MKTALSSSVDEDFRKQRISSATEGSLGAEATRVRAEYIEAGEKTMLECFLASEEKTCLARNMASSFCFFIDSLKSIFNLQQEGGKGDNNLGKKELTCFYSERFDMKSSK